LGPLFPSENPLQRQLINKRAPAFWLGPFKERQIPLSTTGFSSDYSHLLLGPSGQIVPVVLLGFLYGPLNRATSEG